MHTDGGGSPTPRVPPSAAQGPPHEAGRVGRALELEQKEKVRGGMGGQVGGAGERGGWGEPAGGAVAGSPPRLIG